MLAPPSNQSSPQATDATRQSAASGATMGELQAFHDSPRAQCKSVFQQFRGPVPTAEGTKSKAAMAIEKMSPFWNPLGSECPSSENSTNRPTIGRYSDNSPLLLDALDGSPVSFRVTCCTNRSSVADDEPGFEVACTCGPCTGDTGATSNAICCKQHPIQDIYEFPFTKGQRLKVLKGAMMRLYEDKGMKGNPEIGGILEGEFAYFLKAGKNNERLKVQASCGTVGWVTWRHESGIQILAIDAQNV
eukprot:GEMP01025324.1.p1 GENE.GEMP01025324.1~~GEMP01025324.1.p1  ORF type:complete len:246 (+),score=46.40 GEMP01025324.1:151-888(+)